MVKKKVMKKEIDLILALINAWWEVTKRLNNQDEFRSAVYHQALGFNHFLKDVLQKHNAELDIIYHPVKDQWIIREQEER